MASRIILGGRPLGTGKYGGQPKCLCGDDVQILGRCLACHEALRRRRQGLPPKGDAEAKRLRGYLEKHELLNSRCAECDKLFSEEHDTRCSSYEPT